MPSKRAIFRSLGGLPGGIGHYVVPSLSRLVTYIATAAGVSREDFAKWIASEFQVMRSTGHKYIPTLVRLNVIERPREGQLIVSKFGSQFLEADDEGKIRIMTDYLMQRYLALPEVLALYGDSNEPLHLDEVVDMLGPKYSKWTTEAEFNSRIRWLLSLHCLEQVGGGREYVLTEFGRQTLDRLALQTDSSSEVATPEMYVGTQKDTGKLKDIDLPTTWDRQTLAQMLRAAADFVETSR